MSLGTSKALGMLRRLERSRLCSAARTVLAKEGEVGGSSIQCHRRSDSAALVSSDVQSSCGGRNRVSKERRALVESYVNEYRKRNDGKFPSATDAMKHSGGGYYAVRKIIQELEYASRLPPLTSRTVISVESKHIDEKKSLTGGNKFRRRVTSDVDKENSSQKVDKHVERVKEDMKDTSVSSGNLGDCKETAEYFHGTDFNQLQTKKVEQHKARMDVDVKDDFRKQTDKLSLDEKDGVVKHTQKEDFMGSANAAWEAKEHPSQSPSEPEESAKRKDDAEHFGATSFWDNLKTFADGIISIWRRK